MAWNATVADKQYVNGVLKVSVEYSNGVDQKFTEVVDVTGGDITIAKTKVRARLATLVATDDLASKVVIGASLNSVTPSVTPQETFIAAMRHFQSCKRAVDLGLMTVSDNLYTTAQSAMISSYDPSFVDSI